MKILHLYIAYPNSSVSGGDLGWIKRKFSESPNIKKIKNLKLNENTDAIRSSGFLIVKVNEIREIEKQIEDLKKN